MTRLMACIILSVSGPSRDDSGGRCVSEDVSNRRYSYAFGCVVTVTLEPGLDVRIAFSAMREHSTAMVPKRHDISAVVMRAVVGSGRPPPTRGQRAIT